MKTVLITGSSRGIGAAIARQLNKNYKIIINYNKSESSAMKLLNELRKSNPYVIAIKADASKEDEVEKMFEIAERNFSKVDILINNCGKSHYSLLQETSLGDYYKIINTNFTSVFLCTKRAIKSMINNRYGVIINISSIWGEKGSSMESIYSASKGAINSFTKSIAKECAYENIRVNAISPGVVDTSMLRDDFDENEINYLKNVIPLNRFAKDYEIAQLCEYLIDDKSSYITGEIININGGFGI
ncbi:MAG: SDR family oxidoreductase [Tissierellia bacterium]|nr:SDR family oxidoreductase [Tissierellia bacterium]